MTSFYSWDQGASCPTGKLWPFPRDCIFREVSQCLIIQTELPLGAARMVQETSDARSLKASKVDQLLSQANCQRKLRGSPIKVKGNGLHLSVLFTNVVSSPHKRALRLREIFENIFIAIYHNPTCCQNEDIPSACKLYSIFMHKLHTIGTSARIPKCS